MASPKMGPDDEKHMDGWTLRSLILSRVCNRK